MWIRRLLQKMFLLTRLLLTDYSQTARVLSLAISQQFQLMFATCCFLCRFSFNESTLLWNLVEYCQIFIVLFSSCIFIAPYAPRKRWRGSGHWKWFWTLRRWHYRRCWSRWHTHSWRRRFWSSSFASGCGGSNLRLWSSGNWQWCQCCFRSCHRGVFQRGDHSSSWYKRNRPEGKQQERALLRYCTVLWSQLTLKKWHSLW